MNILNIEHLTKAYTNRVLFEDAAFSMQDTEKVGVIGTNGTGKSTLLKIVAGLEEPDEGTITKANHVVICYLPQSPVFDPEKTVIESVVAGYQNRGVSMQEQNEQEHLENWNMESDAKTMLTQLGITNFSQKCGELSGGQRKRLALVSALLTPCDLLILDEPTNHLDNEMSGWLEEYLKKRKGALLMVTHDRYFLDSVSNRIIEIDHGKIYSYQENYSGFLQRKAERLESERASERKRQSILRKELQWVMRGARARSTKQKSRLQRYEEMKEMRGPQMEDQVQMGSVSTRLGRTTIEIENLSKAYGDHVLIKDFTYYFLKNDRIGFVGKNGSGKTTLMKMITGRETPDCGTIKIGQTVKIGYYAQELETEDKEDIAYMNPKDRVIDYIKNTAEYVRTEDGLVSASSMLERFLFSPDQQYSPIEKLSGGERRRLNLLRVLMEAPNVLILDEPTNDLDIQTLTILEDYLDAYDGIVITVSHDRYFLDRVVRRMFAFEENGQLRQYEGGYTDYFNRKREENPDFGKLIVTKEKSTSEKKASEATRTHEKKLKFSYKEEREYETIEADIAALEETIAQCEEDMTQYASDFVKLNELNQKKEEAETALEEKMERWEYLEDLAERIRKQKEGKMA
ncbi:MAG: ABC-F family ATP-binding cassette domain-containing protein [Lachnospiraceae bacterium]